MESLSLITGVKRDLGVLHAMWMGIVFPGQTKESSTVLGRWRPETTAQKAGFAGWAAIGAAVLAVVYPFALAVALIHITASRIDRAAAALGLLGVGAVTLLGWGLFTALAYVRLSLTGFIAVGAASLIATVSAVLAAVASRVDGRPVTVLFAYPLGVTVFFLPPVVAAFYSPIVASVVFPNSSTLAVWLLDNVFWVGGLNEFLSETFELEGINYLVMWVALSFPVGWATGIIATIGQKIAGEGSGLVT